MLNIKEIKFYNVESIIHLNSYGLAHDVIIYSVNRENTAILVSLCIG